MKKIEISNEMYDKLMELATEMTTQDPRCTRMPHLFQIRDWKRVYDWNLNGDTRCWVDNDNDYWTIETFEEMIDYLSNTGVDIPENLKEMWEDPLKLDFDEWVEVS